MISTLTISSAASSLRLLNEEEMRAAVGVTGIGSDSALTALEARLAASITMECNVAIGSGTAPTLLRETVVQTIYGARGDLIVLERRHDVTITSVVEDGVTLAGTDYLVEGEPGLLWRLRDDEPSGWSASKVVITYAAGFATIPGDLKQAAIDFARLAWAESSRDPALKAQKVSVEGVETVEQQFWVGSVPGQTSEGAVPDVVSGQLKRFRNSAFG